MVSTLQTEGINLMLWISDLCWCDLYNEGLADGWLFYTEIIIRPPICEPNA